MKTFDPSEYIKGLSTILISDKKKIGFFFGAGINLSKTSDNSKTIPAIKELTEKVINKIEDKKFKSAIQEIKEEISDNNINIEQLLSLLEEKHNAIGKGKLNSLNKEEFKQLIDIIKKNISNIISIHKDVIPDKQPHTNFGEWLKKANRNYGVEIFTTNYDYLLEIGLEYNNVPYFDGFLGSYEPFFCVDLVEDFSFLQNITKLWKVHGSLGWDINDKTKNIIRKNIDDKGLFIYPSFLKYSESKKMPYEALIDRLYNFVKQDDTLLITCGYSFGDEHINERIISGLNKSQNSSMIALIYDDKFNENKESAKLAFKNSKVSIYSNRYAVTGCEYGKWKLKNEPTKDDTININLYFDEDAPELNSELNKEEKGNEVWTGFGNLIITDFSKLVNFLKSFISANIRS